MNLTGAHIFSIGTWNGYDVTNETLDSLVRSFATLNAAGRVPLKFGHDVTGLAEGDPAIGWVTRIWREGKKLFADFKDIPPQVYEAIQKGLYKFVSIELLQNVEWSGTIWPAVLDSVALLGAERPAVRDLDDLQKLTLSASDPKIRAGAGGSVRLAFNYQGAKRTMPEENKGFDADALKSAITSALAPYQAQVDSLTVKFSDSEKANKALVDENKALKGKLEDQEKAQKAELVKSNKAKFTQIVESAIKRGRIKPPQRDDLNKRFADSDDKIATIDFELVEMICGKPEEPKNGNRNGTAKMFTDDHQSVEDADNAYVEARKRATEKVNAARLQGRHLDVFLAQAQVFREDPELAQRFKVWVEQDSSRAKQGVS